MMTRRNQPGRSFRFAIIDDEDGQVLGYFEDVAGLSGDVYAETEGRTYHQIEIMGCHPRMRLEAWCSGPQTGFDETLGNLQISILNRGEEVIGSYYLGSVRLLKCSRSRNEVGLWNIVMVGVLLVPAHPKALVLWENWRVQAPAKKGLWVPLRGEERAAWLEIVRLHHTHRRRNARDLPSGSVIELDGTNITDYPSFFCALGEAISGPGGYFGADLDGLNDCLRGGFGVVPPFTLRWLNPEVARGSLIRFLPANSGPLSFSTEQPHADRGNRNSGNELSLFEEIMSVFRDNHVTVEFV